MIIRTNCFLYNIWKQKKRKEMFCMTKDKQTNKSGIGAENAQQITQDTIKTNTKVIAINNQKGGVAKSTTSVNVAQILAEVYEKNVLLIDFDAQGSASLMTNIPIWDDSMPNIGDLITPLALHGIRPTIDDILNTVTRGTYEKKYQVKGEFGWKTKVEEYPFDIIPVCGTEISIGELAIHDRENFIYQNVEYSYFMLKLVVDTIVEECNYDYIVIDTNPSLSAFAINALFASDFLIVPTTMAPEAISGIQAIFKRLEELNLVYPYFAPLGIVYQKFDGKRTLDRNILESSIFDEFETKIPDVNTKVSKSINDSLIPSMRKEKQFATFRQAFIDLCGEIIQRIEKYEDENGKIQRIRLEY